MSQEVKQNSSVYGVIAGLFLLLLAIVGTLGLGNTLIPLALSFLMAYLLMPIVLKLESWKIKRELATVIVFVLFSGILLAALLLLMPKMIGELKEFFLHLPDHGKSLLIYIENQANAWGVPIDIDKSFVLEKLKELSQKISLGAVGGLTKGLKGMFTGISSVIVSILNLCLFPVFFYYVIVYYEKIIAYFDSLLPDRIQRKLDKYINLGQDLFRSFFRGQMIVVGVLSTLYAISFSILNLRFGLILGPFVGLMVLVPYIGPTLGFLVVLSVGAINGMGPMGLGLVAGVIIIVQLLESFVLTPRIVGGQVGLNPFLTMLVLIIGGNLFGLVGMIVAIPCGALLKTIVSDLLTYFRSSKWFLGCSN